MASSLLSKASSFFSRNPSMPISEEEDQQNPKDPKPISEKNPDEEPDDKKNEEGEDDDELSKPEASSWNVEGFYTSFPRFRGFYIPSMDQISRLNQDVFKTSLDKESLFRFQFDLMSSENENLSCIVGYRSSTDPPQVSSWWQRLTTSLRYTDKFDRRDSPLRPTQGYAFGSTVEIGGFSPDNRISKYIRQEFDARYAFPLRFCNGALNFGLSVGVVSPLGNGIMNMSSPPPERFFLGGQFSSESTFGGGLTTLFGFNSRDQGSTEVGLVNILQFENDNSSTSSVGDVLACTAFADLSSTLPLKLFSDAGIHGHLFACTGNLTTITKYDFRNFSVRKFGKTFRTCVGAGIIVPTNRFNVEINYCYMLNHLEHDGGKTGIQFSFSSPSS